jgi:hypothetical protein
VRRNLSGLIDQDVRRAVRLVSAARNYSRNLVADAGMAGPLDAGTQPDFKLPSATLRQSLDVVAGAVAGPRDAIYTRSSALFDQAERHLEERSGIAGPQQFAVRDLSLSTALWPRWPSFSGSASPTTTPYPSGQAAQGVRRLPGRRTLTRANPAPSPAQEAPTSAGDTAATRRRILEAAMARFSAADLAGMFGGRVR